MTTNIDNSNSRINFVNSSSKKEITSSVSNQLQTCERVDPATTELPSIQELAPYNIEWMSPELAEKISDFTSNILNNSFTAENSFEKVLSDIAVDISNHSETINNTFLRNSFNKFAVRYNDFFTELKEIICNTNHLSLTLGKIKENNEIKERIGEDTLDQLIELTQESVKMSISISVLNKLINEEDLGINKENFQKFRKDNLIITLYFLNIMSEISNSNFGIDQIINNICKFFEKSNDKVMKKDNLFKFLNSEECLVIPYISQKLYSKNDDETSSQIRAKIDTIINKINQ
ncbi:MAG: hypothetical protein CMP39_02595 [Rickettsiales bacterium]|nr:hypothetical protein [Rickettsiales bacterium]|tara:strand:- start:513 stop:1382 length:870 start_codon:yes stop_codon:yes gene_type:complete